MTSGELLTIIFEGLDHSVHGLRLVVVEAWVVVRVKGYDIGIDTGWWYLEEFDLIVIGLVLCHDGYVVDLLDVRHIQLHDCVYNRGDAEKLGCEE